MLIVQRGKIFQLKVPTALKLAYIHGKGLGVLANVRFKKGDVVLRFEADLVPRKLASPEAVTVDDETALDTKWLVAEAFINHSCSPSTRIDVDRLEYVAVRDIRKNDEITYNYFTTEYDMGSEQFRCHCSAKRCVGIAKGFKFLSRKKQLELAPLLTPFLLKRMRDRKPR